MKSAYIVGTGLAGLAAACFLIRDAQMPGDHITLFEHLPLAGRFMRRHLRRNQRASSCAADARWITTSSVCGICLSPSLYRKSRRDRFLRVLSSEQRKTELLSLCRVTEKQGQDAHTDRKYGLTPGAATQLLKLFMSTNKSLEDKKIDDVFDDEFYATNFWTYWQTMFAFEKWHSALEMKLYLQRYIHHIDGLPDLSALRFTRYNQYESMILPMCKYITDHGGKIAL